MPFATKTAFREDYKSMALMRCEICTKNFSEEHKPVVISCSHSFCLTCVTRIIESRDKRCPVCQQNIEGNSSADLTVNRNLLGLVNYLKQTIGLQILTDSPEDVWKMAEESRDHWQQAEKQIREVVLINKKKIGELQKTNTILADDTRLKLDCIEMENHDIIQKLQVYNAEMKRVTNLVTEMLAVVSAARERAKRSKSFAEYGRIKDDVSHMLKPMQSSINEITADITDNRALHQKINESTNKIQEILRLIPDMDVVAGSLSTYRCITYEEITELTHYSDRMTFMDLGSGGESLVRIVIKYYNNVNFLNHVRNHILLCTGERGPSYVNSKVFEVRDKGGANEFLILGDFERNDGTAGKAVVSSEEAGVWWKRGGSVGIFSSYLCQHGSTEATASQFSILTQKSYGTKIFAYVKEGLSTLRCVFYKCDNVREIEIIDCGRVVYC